MNKIIPISELRSYSTVLSEVQPHSPVRLTKNGYGRYAILDLDEYEELLAKVADYEKQLQFYAKMEQMMIYNMENQDKAISFSDLQKEWRNENEESKN
ncbi:Antitoxin Phd_YefM, type II toxin-antitoxin system [Pilibacter termitis]|uniref:Antitoxin Phd_YefM, type II toxin-antitoxin system n=1 Tax=Pilibacter termitis TaxID=263852 RepID=A0A1T4QZP2_9ENTE|nr:type II toxin-antitoxin system Phd/YefM family antitoxin [Pilibacter termitis]SKA08808.1 Antitoxin Phd_YefM, type II toxin-antitoxin system [Pilibacter termitis]